MRCRDEGLDEACFVRSHGERLPVSRRDRECGIFDNETGVAALAGAARCSAVAMVEVEAVFGRAGYRRFGGTDVVEGKRLQHQAQEGKMGTER